MPTSQPHHHFHRHSQTSMLREPKSIRDDIEMSALYMDRVAPFDLARVTNALMTLTEGARMRQGARPRPKRLGNEHRRQPKILPGHIRVLVAEGGVNVSPRLSSADS